MSNPQPIGARRAKKRWKPSITQQIAVGFLALILLGGLLLSLPIASRSGQATPFLDAVFTSTSATCVTGLIVYDTYLHWSLFGQLVIITLIQIGGLGFMTVATLFSFMLRRRIGLSERELMKESVNSFKVGGIVKLTRRILIGTFAVELVGAAVLSIRFIPELGLWRGIYDSIFMSVSAFCNAGFDLMGYHGPFSSIVPYADDPVIVVTIAALIIIGGLGFLVWDDIANCRFRFKKFRLQTKIVVSVTAALIVIPTVLMTINEWGGPNAGFLETLFQIVTTRTAGFNTVNLPSLHDGTIFLMTILMLVGASSGSTGGGIKTNTVAVLFLSVKATITGKKDMTAFNRRLDDDMIHRATAVTVFYIVSVFVGSFVICCVESLPIRDVVFETVSAMSTVGLTLGITPTLGVVSKLVLMALMYLGRVGGLTVAFALAQRSEFVPVKYPLEKIAVG